MLKLIKVRGNCSDGRTCPAVYLDQVSRETATVVGRQVTDPAVLAQMGIGEGEIAIEVPASLFPELTADEV